VEPTDDPPSAVTCTNAPTQLSRAYGAYGRWDAVVSEGVGDDLGDNPVAATMIDRRVNHAKVVVLRATPPGSKTDFHRRRVHFDRR
jgi:hypothetical protein